MSQLDDWRAQLKQEVLVLMGGHSAERSISLQSGQAIMAALGRNMISAKAVDTAEEGWLKQVTPQHHCFIALHGKGGEDGAVQGALETIGARYTGSGVLACAISQNKVCCKQFWQGLGLSTPPFVVLDDDTDYDSLLEQWDKVVVKPARTGSSIGMKIAVTVDQIRQAYRQALTFDALILAEQCIIGDEFTVGLLGDQILPAVRIKAHNDCYDYQAKYESNDTQFFCSCGLDEPKESQLKRFAHLAFTSLGCRGWGRVDVMKNKNGDFFLLELNSVPGMTDHSSLPLAAKAVGLTFDDLVLEILRLSIVH